MFVFQAAVFIPSLLHPVSSVEEEEKKKKSSDLIDFCVFPGHGLRHRQTHCGPALPRGGVCGQALLAGRDPQIPALRPAVQAQGGRSLAPSVIVYFLANCRNYTNSMYHDVESLSVSGVTV